MASSSVVSLFSIVLLCITIANGFSASSLVNNDDGICKSMVETQGYKCEEHKVNKS